MGSKEPIYEYLEKKIGPKYIKFYTKLSELPPPEQFGNKEKQQLLIFDDMVMDKQQEIVEQYAIRCRKHGAGVSLMYLTQSFYKTSRPLRLQMNYIVLFKLTSARDLNMIIGEFSVGHDKNQLKSIYKDATKEKFNFLKIDIEEPDDNKRFSHNFTGFYQIDDATPPWTPHFHNRRINGEIFPPFARKTSPKRMSLFFEILSNVLTNSFAASNKSVQSFI